MATRVDKLSYDQEKMIGQGRYGTTVFSGFYYEDGDDDKKQPVAVKRIQRIYVKDNKSTVKHEVEMMQKATNHPNVLRYIFFEMDNIFLYLSTELCGGRLEDFFNGKYDGLEKKTISEREILLQVTKGLAHLHELGIVHRDIKPENILFVVSSSPEGTDSTEPNKPSVVMKLADFDIAKILKTERKDFTNTSLTSPNGTRGWMPPELFIKELFDFKVDVWALGCIFGYTLSGGKHPFGDDIKRVIRILEKEPMVLGQKDFKEPYSKDPSIFELIKSMVSVEPDNRPLVVHVLKSSFFKDKVCKDRTAQFLNIFESFVESITDEKITRIQELLKGETVDVNATSSTPYGEEMSALHLLRHHFFDYGPLKFAKDYSKQIELVKELLSHGANVNARANNVKMSPLKMWGWKIELGTRMDLTPLHLLFASTEAIHTADERDFIGIVQLLLKNRADVKAKTDFGETPFHYLCKYYQGGKLHDIAKLLIENGTEINLKDEWGETPLQKLCYFYQNENLIHSLKLLIEKDTDANTKDRNGDNLLYTVCSNYGEKNMLDIVQLLIDKGADVNNSASRRKLFDPEWRSPINSLCRFYRHDNLVDIVQLLIQNGANITVRDPDDPQKVMAKILAFRREFGNTPLHYLCSNYRRSNLKDLVQLLIEKGAHINAKNLYGNTSLHHLCSYYIRVEKIEKDYVMNLINFFLEKGADMNEKNEYGKTPFDILRKGCKNIRSLVID